MKTRTEKHTWYKCEYCEREYRTKRECAACERRCSRKKDWKAHVLIVTETSKGEVKAHFRPPVTYNYEGNFASTPFVMTTGNPIEFRMDVLSEDKRDISEIRSIISEYALEWLSKHLDAVKKEIENKGGE